MGEAHYALGNAAYTLGDFKTTVREWGWVLRNPDKIQAEIELDQLSQRLQRVQRQLKVERGFAKVRTQRLGVDLYYDPKVFSPQFIQQIGEMLNAAYSCIGTRLRYRGPTGLPVHILTTEQLTAITGHPNFHGVYDDILRIGVEIPLKLDKIRETVYHEYTHVVLERITAGRCPFWVQEGAAQLLSEPWTVDKQSDLRKLRRVGKWPSMRQMNRVEVVLSDMEIAFAAYLKSFVAERILSNNYSWERFLNFLALIRAGTDSEEALRAAYGFDFATLERMISAELARGR